MPVEVNSEIRANKSYVCLIGLSEYEKTASVSNLSVLLATDWAIVLEIRSCRLCSLCRNAGRNYPPEACIWSHSRILDGVEVVDA
ncbi:hypothetical protein CY34DRAFT_814095 [Suillus luteus UH-Slu-Lm8-n1]|uniref:Uncharacterized protein n=1 Tax=Suillus luteus UH-Slu-Lm8-n1 TaxID=930992 RepID=A0A0C9ZTU0_9AGAM|nr:hypothetical protein CY34DRAFT_814095 [Suillus luteus UH-Slu-Lm8-n1]